MTLQKWTKRFRRLVPKQCWVTRELAKSAGLKGFLVLYSKGRDGRIERFRVRQLAPTEAGDFTVYTPAEWADRLYALRWCHPLTRTKAEAAPHMCAWAKDSAGSFYCIHCGAKYGETA